MICSCKVVLEICAWIHLDLNGSEQIWTDPVSLVWVWLNFSPKLGFESFKRHLKHWILSYIGTVRLYSDLESHWAVHQDPSLGLEWKILCSEHTELIFSGSSQALLVGFLFVWCQSTGPLQLVPNIEVLSVLFPLLPPCRSLSLLLPFMRNHLLISRLLICI